MEVDQEALAVRIGAAIRAARRAEGLTLVQLADRCQVSQPFLSQIENGRAMTSVLTLHRVAQALRTTAHSLLEGSAAPVTEIPTSLTRVDEGRRYQLSADAVVRFCTPNGRAMDVNEVTAGPHTAADEHTAHAGEEFVRVLRGAIRFEVDGQTFALGSGDSLYYAATRPHRWFNDLDEEATFLMAATPPGF